MRRMKVTIILLLDEEEEFWSDPELISQQIEDSFVGGSSVEEVTVHDLGEVEDE